jgi:hypothetical protein
MPSLALAFKYTSSNNKTFEIYRKIPHDIKGLYNERSAKSIYNSSLSGVFSPTGRPCFIWYRRGTVRPGMGSELAIAKAGPAVEHG